MCSWPSRPGLPGLLAALALVLALLGAGGARAQTSYPGIGRAATPRELKAWDTEVRPDFKGLPRGAGSVDQGQRVWEAKCAACHGVFGESNEVFAPLVGGTTPEDVKSGRVARLTDASFPGRTTLMKATQVSTLWDYINRAMPWTAPKSLSTEEVYAVTAYLLNLGGIVPGNFVLSDTTIAEAQGLMPNRKGATVDHALWPGRGLGKSVKPDVRAVACMRACAGEPQVVSQLPDHARNNHGNLADQQRLVGPQRGADTSQPALAQSPDVQSAVNPPARAAAGPGTAALALAQRHSCTACHAVDSRTVGPGFREIAGKYAARADAEAYLAARIRSGGQGAWGPVPMPAQALSEGDARLIAQWLAAGAKP